MAAESCAITSPPRPAARPCESAIGSPLPSCVHPQIRFSVRLQGVQLAALLIALCVCRSQCEMDGTSPIPVINLASGEAPEVLAQQVLHAVATVGFLSVKLDGLGITREDVSVVARERRRAWLSGRTPYVLTRSRSIARLTSRTSSSRHLAWRIILATRSATTTLRPARLLWRYTCTRPQTRLVSSLTIPPRTGEDTQEGRLQG